MYKLSDQIKEEFRKVEFAVKRSQYKFNQEDSIHSQEQLNAADGKEWGRRGRERESLTSLKQTMH